MSQSMTDSKAREREREIVRGESKREEDRVSQRKSV